MRKVSPNAAKKFETRQINRIHKWRQRHPGFVARTVELLLTPIVWAFRRAIPPTAVEATLHGNLWLARRWAREGKTLRTLGVADFREMTQAELLHPEPVVRTIHRRAVWMAAGIGFSSGIFGFLALPVGMAGALNLALRTIHRIGLCYGYPATSEGERLFIYYVLSLAGNRSPHDKAVSLQALAELQAAMAAAAPASRLTTADETGADDPLHPHIRQKAFTIAHHDFSAEITRQLVVVRLLTSIPGIGGLVALIVDTRYMRSVGWAARHAYQLRWLTERGRLPETLRIEQAH
jgi:hypothetical protein